MNYDYRPLSFVEFQWLIPLLLQLCIGHYPSQFQWEKTDYLNPWSQRLLSFLIGIHVAHLDVMPSENAYWQ